MQIDKKQLHELLQKLASVRLLVVGDMILDEFITGEVLRISREAPVPILRHRSTRLVPGGAANAANNGAALGAKVAAIGVVGADSSGQNLRAVLQEAGVDTSGLLVDPNQPTTTKTRISATSQQSVTQQVARVDRLMDPPLDEQVCQDLCDHLAETILNYDAVLISDYLSGVVTEDVIALCRQGALQAKKVLTVDSQKDLALFKGAAILTPNQPEAERVLGYRLSDRATLEQGGWELLDKTEADALLITRGAEGMSLFDRSGKVYHIPAFNRTEVFDVTGAGDTVIATLTLALAAGGDTLDAVILANLAASIVIRRFGTCTTNTHEIADALNHLELGDIPVGQRSLVHE